MTAWRELTAEEFYEHPLNRMRGGMGFTLTWIGFQSLFALVLLILLVTLTEEMIDPLLPQTYEWASWAFLLTGPPIVLCLLIWRVAWAPAIYLAYFVGVLLFEFIAEVWSPFFLDPATYTTGDGLIALAVFLSFTVVDLIVLRYLFFSERANVILHRRARA
ncbi:MAG: hypothetical protein AAGE80_13590 [Pseudomonadota bacterium]